jgi:hypothetical protein
MKLALQKCRELYDEWERSRRPDDLRKLLVAGCTPSTIVNDEKDTLLHAAARRSSLDVRQSCLLTTDVT